MSNNMKAALREDLDAAEHHFHVRVNRLYFSVKKLNGSRNATIWLLLSGIRRYVIVYVYGFPSLKVFGTCSTNSPLEKQQ